MNGATTVATAFAAAAGRLDAAGIPESRLEARILLAEAVGGGGRAPAERERRLSAAEEERLARLISRRLGREPIAQITGRREFWSHSFQVTADTLIPRPDSETLIEAALAWVGDRQTPASVLDLGTGSGCLLLACLSELPNARGVGIDIVEAALAVARKNAQSLGLAGRAHFVGGDWGESLGRRFDLILANPPYIPEGELDRLAPEVARFEPRVALAGGADGLDGHRRIAPAAARLLAPGGALFLEIGLGQAAAAAAVLALSGLETRAVRADLGGRDRCLVATRTPESRKKAPILKKRLE